VCGLARYDGRVAVEEALKELGLFRGKTDNKMALGFCQRSGDIIEPYLTPQWSVTVTHASGQLTRMGHRLVVFTIILSSSLSSSISIITSLLLLTVTTLAPVKPFPR
jgi:valyl-tRNA synthetase